MSPGLFKVTQSVLKQWQLHHYSNIPYSAFKTSLVLEENPTGITQRLGKFRWRSNVTTLRAPKHFKVGRQHYNRARRCSIIKFTNPRQSLGSCSCTTLRAGISKYGGIQFCEVQQPLSVVKTIRITLG